MVATTPLKPSSIPQAGGCAGCSASVRRVRQAFTVSNHLAQRNARRRRTTAPHGISCCDITIMLRAAAAALLVAAVGAQSTGVDADGVQLLNAATTKNLAAFSAIDVGYRGCMPLSVSVKSGPDYTFTLDGASVRFPRAPVSVHHLMPSLDTEVPENAASLNRFAVPCRPEEKETRTSVSSRALACSARASASFSE